MPFCLNGTKIQRRFIKPTIPPPPHSTAVYESELVRPSVDSSNIRFTCMFTVVVTCLQLLRPNVIIHLCWYILSCVLILSCHTLM